MNNLFQNVKPKSKELYISNIKRLNNGKDVDINNLDFLEDVDGILEKLTSKYAKTTIRSYFISICSLLSELPKYKSLYDKYYKILISQNKSLEKNNTKSESQKENWISQDEVLQKQIEVQDKALSLMESRTKYKPRGWSIILDWVILSLYTLLPPRRIIDYTEMNIVNDTSLEADEKMNYWVKSKEKFIFTNYKTSGTYKTQIVKIPEPLQYVLDKYMEVRRDRDENNIPLLVNNKGEAIRANYLITKALNRIFDKKVSVNMLRNIYLTSNFKETLTHIQSTASAMGTSPETIQNHYIKLDEDILDVDNTPSVDTKSREAITEITKLVEDIPNIKPKDKKIKINKINKLVEDLPDTTPKDKKIKINKIIKLVEGIPNIQPKDKGIKINKIIKLVEDIPNIQPKDKGITIKRVEKPVFPEVKQIVVEDYDEEEEHSTESEYSSDSDIEIEDERPVKIKEIKKYPKKDIEAVRKIYIKLNKLGNSPADESKSEKLYAQLDNIDDAYDIMSYLDEEEEPPIKEDETLNTEEKETYSILTDKDKILYDRLFTINDKKEFLQKTQKKYDNAEKARVKKQIKDEAEQKKLREKTEKDRTKEKQEKKEKITKLKEEWKNMTPAQKKSWKNDKISEWKKQFPHETNIPKFEYWAD